MDLRWLKVSAWPSLRPSNAVSGGLTNVRPKSRQCKSSRDADSALHPYETRHLERDPAPGTTNTLIAADGSIRVALRSRSS